MKSLERRIIAETLSLGLILALILFIFTKRMIAFGIGLGTLVSILNFKLLAKDIASRVSSGRAGFYSFFLKFPLRYGIMAVVLWLAIKKDFNFFIGTAVGLFGVRIAIYIDQFLVKKDAGYRKNNN